MMQSQAVNASNFAAHKHLFARQPKRSRPASGDSLGDEAGPTLLRNAACTHSMNIKAASRSSSSSVVVVVAAAAAAAAAAVAPSNSSSSSILLFICFVFEGIKWRRAMLASAIAHHQKHYTLLSHLVHSVQDRDHRPIFFLYSDMRQSLANCQIVSTAASRRTYFGGQAAHGCSTSVAVGIDQAGGLPGMSAADAHVVGITVSNVPPCRYGQTVQAVYTIGAIVDFAAMKSHVNIGAVALKEVR
jgi:hypothetical protein